MTPDLEAIAARLRAPRPAPDTPAFWVWSTQRDCDVRDLVEAVRQLRALWNSVAQEGAGKLD